VILGHSERRQLFGEPDDLINRKVKAAIENDLVPVFAVGELLEQREAGHAERIVTNQLVEGLAGLVREEAARVVIAYEPVWAIGTGKTASPEDAQAMHATIRGWLTERYGEEVANAIRILYGGSVKPNNVDELMAQSDIDGALVGGASLDAKGFGRIVNFQ
jgi:triosephosphate isomerase